MLLVFLTSCSCACRLLRSLPDYKAEAVTFLPAVIFWLLVGARDEESSPQPFICAPGTAMTSLVEPRCLCSLPTHPSL